MHLSIGSARNCPTDKMFQTPLVLALSLVQLAVVSDDMHEMKRGGSFVAEVLCQVFLKLFAAAVL